MLDYERLVQKSRLSRKTVRKAKTWPARENKEYEKQSVLT